MPDENEAAAATAKAPGFSTERMAMFTDAVFAIAMTLLVVEIKRPERGDLRGAAALGRFLLGEWSSFLAFLIAFYLLWGVWRRHNALTDQIAHWNPATMVLHGPVLILVAFLPFPTALVGGEGIQNPLAVSLFAGALAVLVFCEAAIKVIVVRADLLRPGADPGYARRGAGASMTVGAYFVLTAALSWWMHAIAIAWLFAPLAATAGGRMAARRRRRADPA